MQSRLPKPHRLILWTTLAAATVLVVGLAACAPSSLAPYTFPASYQFMGSPGDFSVAPECARYAEIAVVDGRENSDKVGVRYLEEGGPRHDVGMDGDVEGWLREGVEQAFREASIRQDDGSSHTVTVTLESIETDEAVYRRAEYDGKVVLRTRVSGGGADWQGGTDGFAENYGYAGKALNYQETVNHALDKALAKLVNDSGFRDALCR
jgi:hypothetical protein